MRYLWRAARVRGLLPEVICLLILIEMRLWNRVTPLATNWQI